ncbi:MAG: 5-oxopent-3-ene-1,2,5-tricarboxylate decarboxylase [Acidobacteria bacterium]|nr:MAG: 5-oxopent-3-ene-1,2,5-tricarboxylate decarboxylase [Acidobacteriota bacterium]
MRFVTFQHNGSAVPGVISADKVVGLRGAGFPNLLSVIEGGFDARRRIDVWMAKPPADALVPLSQARLRSPLPRPPKIICVGLNYRDHAIESKMEIPKVPTIFSKYSTSVIGPGEPIVLPKLSAKPDYEAEFAFIIGKGGRHIERDRWKEHIFGYTNFNDVSARDYQMATTQWMMGKTFDTFAPMGPAIVTADEIADPHALDIQMIINGEVLQSSNTSNLIFRIPELIEYLSGVFTLEAGDVISTGTPSGVGFSKNPPRWLRAGDDVVVRIAGLGELRNPVVAE